MNKKHQTPPENNQAQPQARPVNTNEMTEQKNGIVDNAQPATAALPNDTGMATTSSPNDTDLTANSRSNDNEPEKLFGYIADKEPLSLKSCGVSDSSYQALTAADALDMIAPGLQGNAQAIYGVKNLLNQVENQRSDAERDQYRSAAMQRQEQQLATYRTNISKLTGNLLESEFDTSASPAATKDLPQTGIRGVRPAPVPSASADLAREFEAGNAAVTPVRVTLTNPTSGLTADHPLRPNSLSSAAATTNADLAEDGNTALTEGDGAAATTNAALTEGDGAAATTNAALTEDGNAALDSEKSSQAASITEPLSETAPAAEPKRPTEYRPPLSLADLGSLSEAEQIALVAAHLRPAASAPSRLAKRSDNHRPVPTGKSKKFSQDFVNAIADGSNSTAEEIADTTSGSMPEPTAAIDSTTISEPAAKVTSTSTATSAAMAPDSATTPASTFVATPGSDERRPHKSLFHVFSRRTNAISTTDTIGLSRRIQAGLKALHTIRSLGGSLIIRSFIPTAVIYLLMNFYFFNRTQGEIATVFGYGLSNTILLLAGLFIPVLLAVQSYGFSPTDVTGEIRPSPILSILSVLISLPALLVINGADNVFIYLQALLNIPNAHTYWLSESYMISKFPSLSVWALVLIIFGILQPIIEEIFFRGLLLKSLKTTVSYSSAVIIQAILYALIKPRSIISFATIIVGLFLGYLVVFAQSLWPAILAHITLNFGHLALLVFYPQLLSQDIFIGIKSSRVIFQVSLICCILGILVLWPGLRLMRNFNPPAVDPQRRKSELPPLRTWDWRLVLGSTAYLLLKLLLL